MGSEASDLQHLVHRRAAGGGRLGSWKVAEKGALRFEIARCRTEIGACVLSSDECPGRHGSDHPPLAQSVVALPRLQPLKRRGGGEDIGIRVAAPDQLHANRQAIAQAGWN